MKIITTVSEMQSLAATLRQQEKRIGFVPTMGFLHEGHLSLIGKAREEADIVVASIFVNPTQFGPNEDLDRYPRDAEGDRKKCEAAGVDILFMPGAKEMYPEKPAVFVTVEGISDILEGAIRPGHFRGVATVVAKLFNVVKPARAYFGQKDFQQCVVISRMVKGLNMDVDIQVLPTMREPSGLAMSSRNTYLDDEERRKASILSAALKAGAGLIASGTKDAEAVKNRIGETILAEPGITIDYIEVADPENLEPVRKIEQRAVLLAAVRIGRTRLIDNMLAP